MSVHATKSTPCGSLRPALLGLALGAILSTAAGPRFAAAQTAGSSPRSTTGRHPPRELVDPAQRDLAFPVYKQARRWTLAIGGGLMSGNDLFRVKFDTAPNTWTLPSGVIVAQPSAIRVTLDEDVLVVGSLAYHLPPRWQLRCDLGWSEVDATAEVKDAQTVLLYLYDRMAFWTLAMSMECRLATTRSYPYVLGGVSLVDVSAQKAAGLDQSRLAWRAGFGFHWGFPGGWGLRAEVRDNIRQLDMKEHGDETFPGREFEESGPQHLYELSLQVRTML